MTRPPLAVLLAVAAMWVSGCGTIANLKTGEPDLYGGVQRDIQLLEAPRPQPAGIGIRNLGALVLFVDLPLCVVGDTLTMPLAIYEWHRGGGDSGTTVPIGDGGQGTTAPATSHPDQGS
jgi:uncharacterized protein YceK